MHEWNTILSHAFLQPEFAKTGLEMIYRVAKLEKIPENATWSTSIRGICIIIFAIWPRKAIKEEE